MRAADQITIDGDGPVTWVEFIECNEFEAKEALEISEALDRDGFTSYGGGAAGEFRLRRIGATPRETAEIICRKWVRHFGGGFHPDTRGEDYVDWNGAPLTSDEAADYDRDMEALFALEGIDPYGVGLDAFREAGLIEREED